MLEAVTSAKVVVTSSRINAGPNMSLLLDNLWACFVCVCTREILKLHIYYCCCLLSAVFCPHIYHKRPQWTEVQGLLKSCVDRWTSLSYGRTLHRYASNIATDVRTFTPAQTVTRMPGFKKCIHPVAWCMCEISIVSHYQLQTFQAKSHRKCCNYVLWSINGLQM